MPIICAGVTRIENSGNNNGQPSIKVVECWTWQRYTLERKWGRDLLTLMQFITEGLIVEWKKILQGHKRCDGRNVWVISITPSLMKTRIPYRFASI